MRRLDVPAPGETPVLRDWPDPIPGAGEVPDIVLSPVQLEGAGGYVGGGIDSWFPYVMALAFLLVRPEGLFGEKHIDRV